MKKLLTVVVFAAIGSASAFSQAYDGQTLHDWWQAFQRVSLGTATGADSFYSSHYQGYVTGVWDSILCLQSTKVIKVVVNADANLKMAAVFAVVGKFLDDHPEMWGYPGGAAGMVIMAITTTYPPVS